MMFRNYRLAGLSMLQNTKKNLRQCEEYIVIMSNSYNVVACFYLLC